MNYIIIDSNIIHISNHNDYFNFNLNKSYTDLQGRIERRDLTDSFKILIPDIVFRELHKQKLEQFKIDYDQLTILLKKFKSFSEVSLDLPKDFNYDEFLKQKISEFKSRNSIKTINVNSGKDTFNKIIEKSINKKPPFEGANKKSDKGFKDVLIWESLLNYANNNPGNYYFYTKDKGFSSILIEEFSQLTNECTIEFIDENNKHILNNLIDNMSEEKINSERLFKIKKEISLIIPELKEKLMKNIFNTFSVNNIPNYKVDYIDFPEEIFELTDLSNSSFTFKCYCNLKAIKTDNTISMNISFDFLVNTSDNNNSQISSIEIESISAMTQDEDELILNIKPFKMTFNIDNKYKNKNEYYSDNKTFKKSNTTKKLDEINKSLVNKVISENHITFYKNNELDELYSIIASNESIDWVHFDKKISQMKLSIKKFLNQHNIYNSSNITDTLVTKLIKNYKD